MLLFRDKDLSRSFVVNVINGTAKWVCKDYGDSRIEDLLILSEYGLTLPDEMLIDWFGE